MASSIAGCSNLMCSFEIWLMSSDLYCSSRSSIDHGGIADVSRMSAERRFAKERSRWVSRVDSRGL